MNTYKVTGPNGVTTVREMGKWDACNAQRSADKGRTGIDLTDLAAEAAGGPGSVTLVYLSDRAHYSAELTE